MLLTLSLYNVPLRNPSVWLAFLVMLSMCVPQFRSSDMVTPRYFAADTLSNSVL